ILVVATNNKRVTRPVNLIVHSNQSQPVGRSRKTSLGTIPTLQNLTNESRCLSSPADVYQRSDYRPHHIAQEAVTFGKYQNFVLKLLNFQTRECADMIPNVGFARSERAEIVSADKRSCC